MKLRFRLIYDSNHEIWALFPLNYFTHLHLLENTRFLPWPVRGKKNTWIFSDF